MESKVYVSKDETDITKIMLDAYHNDPYKYKLLCMGFDVDEVEQLRAASIPVEVAQLVQNQRSRVMLRQLQADGQQFGVTVEQVNAFMSRLSQEGRDGREL